MDSDDDYESSGDEQLMKQEDKEKFSGCPSDEFHPYNFHPELKKLMFISEHGNWIAYVRIAGTNVTVHDYDSAMDAYTEILRITTSEKAEKWRQLALYYKT